MDWAARHKLGLDFNGSFFSHPLAASGMTLAHADRAIRRYWIGHALASRRISAAIGPAAGKRLHQ